MSTLYTDNIRANNASQITVPTGQKIVGTDSGSIIAPGHLVQTVIGSRRTTNVVASTNSYIDVVSANITPIQSSSIFKVCLYYHSGGSHAMRLKRGSTVVFQPTDTYFNYDADEYSGQNAWNSSSSRRVVAMSYVDSPATTSQITYSWQLAAYLAANGSGAGINELTGTSGSAYTYMEILEIAQ